MGSRRPATSRRKFEPRRPCISTRATLDGGFRTSTWRPKATSRALTRRPSSAWPRRQRRTVPSPRRSRPRRSRCRQRSRAASPPSEHPMRAMQLRAVKEPLRLVELPVPKPAGGQVLIRVSVCAVCRTDLHIVNGELSEPKLPLVMGHMIVGQVQSAGAGAHRFATGERIGVPWLGSVDESCRFCRRGLENLCVNARFTGYHVHGGYAEFCVADERFCFALPESYDDLHVAPLLCAGLIGYRALRLAGDAQRLGLYGFGDSAHIIAQVARYQGRPVFAFTSRGDAKKPALARSLRAERAGDSPQRPPRPLHAAP